MTKQNGIITTAILVAMLGLGPSAGAVCRRDDATRNLKERTGPQPVAAAIGSSEHKGTAETWRSGAATNMRAPLEPQRCDERREDSRRESPTRNARFWPCALRQTQTRGEKENSCANYLALKDPQKVAIRPPLRTSRLCGLTGFSTNA